MSVETADTDNSLTPRELRRALDLDQRRTARQIYVSAHATVSEPQRAALPLRMSKDIMNSLTALKVDELGRLLRASTAAIIRLIPGTSGRRIDAVVFVQLLQHCLLLFSKVLSPGEDLPDYAEGDSGAKRRFG
ncbi:hypothetical protein [Bradyrhizobium sp. SBR1B]|uniref:hypothetical protein n=1 Tax=Bradyrhizobium sp. SBR1B TaxID=2663836 RepID=UPI001605EEAE|nr:hypothetical protein [Bradyrhizobium sp. SBR1B]MBB4377235.1 hypothetical protein [Bradyrhizobium sp. SBR1B]